MKKVMIIAVILAITVILGCVALAIIYPTSDNSHNLSLSEEQIVVIPSECMEWAFGKNWKHVKTSERDSLWNERHSNLFVVHGTDDYFLSMGKIYKAWRDERRSKQ